MITMQHLYFDRVFSSDLWPSVTLCYCLTFAKYTLPPPVELDMLLEHQHQLKNQRFFLHFNLQQLRGCCQTLKDCHPQPTVFHGRVQNLDESGTFNARALSRAWDDSMVTGGYMQGALGVQTPWLHIRFPTKGRTRNQMKTDLSFWISFLGAV